IAVTFIDRDGVTVPARAVIGENLLDAAHARGVELEGACEGSLACSTCHVVFDSEDVFASLPEACDDENDMLDLAYGLTATSRLGCQVIATRGAMEGCVVRVPRATRNFAVDGFKPKPH
ncbi:2Fe-2S ferredoxin-type domain-containing protein, partial [Ostreococcus tauri]